MHSSVFVNVGVSGMKRAVSLLCPAFAAAALVAATALPASAAPEPTGPGGVSDGALLTVAGTAGDDVFATTDLTSLLDPTGASTQHYGPYSSMSTDSGTCGNDWANDTFDRHFTVHRNPDGTLTVIEQFKNGSFVTPASDSPPTNFSPGACQPAGPPQGTVNSGVVGDLHGYFIIPLPAGEMQTSFDSSCVSGTPSAPCTTTDFINTHFTPACYPTTCTVTTFFFHYSAGDQSLIDHEWKNASADRGGNSGDIRSTNL
jgi:hypothetical protein